MIHRVNEWRKHPIIILFLCIYNFIIKNSNKLFVIVIEIYRQMVLSLIHI